MKPLASLALLLLATGCTAPQDGTPIPRYHGPLEKEQRQGVAEADYAPIDRAVGWRAPDTILILHVENYGSGEIRSSSCPGSGFYAVPVHGGAARAIGTGEPYCVDGDGMSEDATLSGDGRSAFTTVRRGHGPTAIVRLRLPDGAADTLPVSCGIWTEGPTPAPDGRWIAFESDCGPTRPNEQAIYLVHPDGSGLRRLSGNPAAAAANPAWSPDGRRLVYERSRGSGQGYYVSLVVADVAGQERELGVRGMGPAWSPDGRWLAYVAAAPERSGARSLHVVRPDGTGDRIVFQNRVTSTFDTGWGPAVEGQPASSLVWSPDGRWIAFGRLYGSGISLWRLNLATGEAVRVTRRGE
jgi:Tol biopolymer transport system component